MSTANNHIETDVPAGIIDHASNVFTAQQQHLGLTKNHASSAFDICVTFTFDLLPSRSVHMERLPRTACVPSLVLIAQIVFLL